MWRDTDISVPSEHTKFRQTFQESTALSNKASPNGTDAR